MSFLKNNYDNIEDRSFEPLPTGIYECVINKVQEHATPSGAESLQLDLVVRNDLDGVNGLEETNKKYHNRHVFMDNWRRKATGQYDAEGLMTISRAAGEPDGKDYSSIDDYMQSLFHKPVKVYIKKTENTYNGKTTEINQIAPFNMSVTGFPQVQHNYGNLQNGQDIMDNAIRDINKSQGNTNFGNQNYGQNNNDPFSSGNQIDITDDDLPF